VVAWPITIASFGALVTAWQLALLHLRSRSSSWGVLGGGILSLLLGSAGVAAWWGSLALSCLLLGASAIVGAGMGTAWLRERQLKRS
jgi:hypothetical protein